MGGQHSSSLGKLRTSNTVLNTPEFAESSKLSDLPLTLFNASSVCACHLDSPYISTFLCFSIPCHDLKAVLIEKADGRRNVVGRYTLGDESTNHPELSRAKDKAETSSLTKFSAR